MFGGTRSGSAQRLELGVATFVIFGVLAATAGAAVPWNPLVVALAAVAAVCAVRFGVTNVLLHTLVLSMFFESVAVSSVRLGRVLAVAIVVFLVFRFLLTDWRPPRLPVLVWLPALLFGAWMWTSGFWAVSVPAWQGYLGAIALAAAYFLGFALLVESPTQLRQLLRTFVLGAGVMSIVAVAQAGANVRSVGLQGDPNIFALYQVAAIPAAGMLARTTTAVWGRVGWLLLTVPLTASVFAAQSRGGLLTLAIMLPIALVRGDFGRLPRGHVAFSLLTTAGVVALLGFVAGQVDSRLTLAAVAQDKGTGRLTIWHAAWHAYLQRPLSGLGAGGFEAQSSHLLEVTPGVDLDPYSILLRTGIRVHNMYLENLTDLGPVGLLLWLAILAGTVAVIVRCTGVRVTPTPTSPLLVMLLAFSFATVFLSLPNSKLLWMIVGLAAAAASTRYTTARNAALEDSPLPARWAPAGVAAAVPERVTGWWDPQGRSITYSSSSAPWWRSPGRPALENPPA